MLTLVTMLPAVRLAQRVITAQQENLSSWLDPTPSLQWSSPFPRMQQGVLLMQIANRQAMLKTSDDLGISAIILHFLGLFATLWYPKLCASTPLPPHFLPMLHHRKMKLQESWIFYGPCKSLQGIVQSRAHVVEKGELT